MFRFWDCKRSGAPTLFSLIVTECYHKEGSDYVCYHR